MKCIIFFGLLIGSFIFTDIIYAQGNFNAVRNPFIPQLPIKKVEVRDETVTAQPIELPNPAIKPPVEVAARQTPEPKPVPKLEITGLVWNTKRPQAIINGAVLSVGDKVEEVKIVAIRKSEIDVEFQGRLMTIKL